MSVEADIYTVLTANSGLASFIGTRLIPNSPVGLPQGTVLPAITYQRISSVREYMYPGRTGVVRTRFQFNLFGRKLLESRAMADALVAAIDDLPMDSRVEGPRDLSDPEAKVSYPSLDVLVTHQEAV